VDWDIAEQNLLYASVETGFKAGGFFFSHDQGYFKPETIKAYTLGSKNRFLDNRLQLNIEAYYWKYTDQQFSHLGTDSTGSILFPTENIGDATMKGVEVSAQLHPFRGTLLGADIQYNDAVYNSFVYHTPNLNGGITNGTGCANAGVTAAFYVVNCSGQRPPNAPLWSLDADIQQTIFLGRAGTLTGEARVHFQTATLTGQEFLKVDVQPAYAIANFSLMYSPANGRFSVTGFVNNAFNRTVLGYSEVPPFAYFAVGDLRPPRTYGIRFGVHIG
jgi:iron complex outermembrane receptor protein